MKTHEIYRDKIIRRVVTRKCLQFFQKNIQGEAQVHLLKLNSRDIF